MQHSRLRQWRRWIRRGPPPGRQILPPCFVWKERKPLTDNGDEKTNVASLPTSWRCPGMYNETWRHVRPWKFEASRKSRAQGPLQAACRMLSQKLSRITLKMSDFEEYEQLKKTREKEMDTSQNGGPPKSPQGPVLKIKSSRSGTVRSSTPEH